MMEFNSSGTFNGQQLDVPVHRLLPEKITGNFDEVMCTFFFESSPHGMVV